MHSNQIEINLERNGQAEVGVCFIKNSNKKVTRVENGHRVLADKKVLIDYRNTPRATVASTPMGTSFSHKPRRIIDFKQVRFDVVLDLDKKIVKNKEVANAY